MRISNLLAISWLLMGVFSISAPAALASPGDVSLNLENSWNNAFLGAAHPMGLAIDQDDNVYFVDSEQSIVFKMTGSSAPVHLITDILTPQGVAVDAAGNLYVAGWSDFAVYRVDPSGTDETVYASEIWDPTSVALDSAGNVYVTDYSSNVVYKITGVETKETIGSGFLNPYGIAVDPASNVYVTNSGGDTVSRITPGGSTSTILSGLSSPAGIAVHPAGHIFVADSATGQIHVITPDERHLTLNEGLNGPKGLAFDSSNNLYVLDNTGLRKYTVTVESSAPPTLPVAGFSADRTSGLAPLNVQFADASTGYASSWQWNFGDGSPNSTSQNPEHTFSAPGTYTVTLTAINANGTSTMQKSNYITTIAPTLPVSDFSANPTIGLAPLNVQFTDASTGYASSWQWNFGDGSPNSTSQSPLHQYASAGTYTVTLTAINANGSSTLERPVYVNVIAPTLPVADFSANPTIGLAPLDVQFTDASTGYASSWQWNFGDGSPNSTSQNPAHTFSAPGTYTVTLTAINANGSSTLHRAGYVTAIAPTLPVADFSANPTIGLAPLNVQFTDASTGYASSWQWNFGDGSSNSTEQSPVHQYTDAGTYTVTLTAINANGTSTIQRNSYVTAIAPTLPSADFGADPGEGLAPLSVQFTDASTGHVSAWAWDFGDSAFGSANSTEQNPAHVYASAGTYTVTLTAINANGTSTVQRSNYVTVVAPTLPVADFSGNPTVGLAPLDVQFTDASTGYASSWEWDFGDGTPNSTEQSPLHQYVSAGTYTVTLTAINANGTSTVYRAGYVTVNAPEALVAGFTADRISGDAPLTVNFTDTSSGSPASWQWNFGDGSPNSTEQNPAHTYTTPGQYTVRLAVTNSTGATAGNSTQIEVRGPEEEPTSYTLSLRQGWNLVSFPVVNTSLQASSLQESGVLIVASYNRTTGDYDSFNTQVSPLTYDITLRTDVGYFLYCTRDTSIEVLGETPSRRSTTLYPGWNLVGWSSLTSSDAKSVVEEPSLTGRQIVAKFNATTGDYDAYAEGISLDSYNFPMDHGTSYFVYTDSVTSQTLYFETLHD